ncbi:MAG: hypothetical protein Q9225_001915 [Loekoesia sp. 1 TL-2023]
MLMAQILIEVLQSWHNGKLPDLQNALLQEKVVPALFRHQCLVQLLQSQHQDGSWGSRCPQEETAYALLTLTRLRILPPAQFLEMNLIGAIDRGRKYLRQTESRRAEFLWVEKVTYHSEKLSEAYIIAARYNSTERPSLSHAIFRFSGIDCQQMANFAALTETGPFSRDLIGLTSASWIIARLYAHLLQKAFGGLLSTTYERVAFQWTLRNNRVPSVVSPQLLLDMMLAPLLTDNIIALVEESITSEDKDQLISLKATSYQALRAFDGLDCEVVPDRPSNPSDYHLPKANGIVKTFLNAEFASKEHQAHYSGNSTGLSEAFTASKTISSSIGSFEKNDSVLKASRSDRQASRLELKRFFLACVTRLESEEHRLQSIYRQCTVLGLSGEEF